MSFCVSWQFKLWFLVHAVAQPELELVAATSQARHDRAHGDIKHGGDFFVRQSFELAEEVRAAIGRARSYPAATPADVFDHVYANPPSRVLDQRRTLLDS